MPGHRRGVKDIAFDRVIFAHVFELPPDLSHLHDPPFSRPRMEMAERRFWIERGISRLERSAADVAITVAAFVIGRVHITEEWAGKQMIVLHYDSAFAAFDRVRERIEHEPLAFRV